mmetsp:Transcript_17533/g.48834  ORF Transcript_17533/g.48834 Transcript_17533/m.48834 type:complete len:247 (-) Transcript_17533:1988-2728(-)
MSSWPTRSCTRSRWMTRRRCWLRPLVLMICMTCWRRTNTRSRPRSQSSTMNAEMQLSILCKSSLMARNSSLTTRTPRWKLCRATLPPSPRSSRRSLHLSTKVTMSTQMLTLRPLLQTWSSCCSTCASSGQHATHSAITSAYLRWRRTASRLLHKQSKRRSLASSFGIPSMSSWRRAKNGRRAPSWMRITTWSCPLTKSGVRLRTMPCAPTQWARRTQTTLWCPASRIASMTSSKSCPWSRSWPTQL